MIFIYFFLLFSSFPLNHNLCNLHYYNTTPHSNNTIIILYHTIYVYIYTRNMIVQLDLYNEISYIITQHSTRKCIILHFLSSYSSTTSYNVPTIRGYCHTSYVYLHVKLGREIEYALENVIAIIKESKIEFFFYFYDSQIDDIIL